VTEQKYDPALLRALGAGPDEVLDVFVHFEHAISQEEAAALAAQDGLAVRPGKTLATARVKAGLIPTVAANPAVRYISLARQSRMLG
jgi:hypothetical protein